MVAILSAHQEKTRMEAEELCKINSLSVREEIKVNTVFGKCWLEGCAELTLYLSWAGGF